MTAYEEALDAWGRIVYETIDDVVFRNAEGESDAKPWADMTGDEKQPYIEAAVFARNA
jgi:hypothetical protein